MVAVVEHAAAGMEVRQAESLGKLRDLFLLPEGVKPRLVAGRALGSGRQTRDEAAIAGDAHLIHPAETGAMLADDAAVFIQDEQVWTAGRRDGADRHKLPVFARIKAGNPLLGKRAQSPRVPAGHTALGRETHFDDVLRGTQRRRRRHQQKAGRADPRHSVRPALVNSQRPELPVHFWGSLDCASLRSANRSVTSCPARMGKLTAVSPRSISGVLGGVVSSTPWR